MNRKPCSGWRQGLSHHLSQHCSLGFSATTYDGLNFIPDGEQRNKLELANAADHGTGIPGRRLTEVVDAFAKVIGPEERLRH